MVRPLVLTVPSDGLREQSAVLTQRLPVSPVVLHFQEIVRPPELLERNRKPLVVRVEQRPPFGATGGRRGCPKVRPLDVTRQPCRELLDHGPYVVQRILLEQHEVRAELIEPLDEPVEIRRRAPEVHLGACEHAGTEEDAPANRLPRPRRCAAYTPGVSTPRGASKCAGPMEPPSIGRPMNAFVSRPAIECAALTRTNPPAQRPAPVPEGPRQPRRWFRRDRSNGPRELLAGF